MKAFAKGTSRQLDSLGRIVIPKDFRRRLDIDTGDYVEIMLTGEQLLIQKRHTSCVFCGNEEGLLEFADKPLCLRCAKSIQTLAQNNPMLN